MKTSLSTIKSELQVDVPPEQARAPDPHCGTEVHGQHEKRTPPFCTDKLVGTTAQLLRFFLTGHYVQDACVFGPGDLPWIIQSPSLFASKFEPSAEPLVVLCLERWHRLRVLGQAEVPTEPHWHFRQQSHFNMS